MESHLDLWDDSDRTQQDGDSFRYSDQGQSPTPDGTSSGTSFTPTGNRTLGAGQDLGATSQTGEGDCTSLPSGGGPARTAGRLLERRKRRATGRK